MTSLGLQRGGGANYMGGALVSECKVFRKIGEKFEEQGLDSKHLHCLQCRKIGNGNELLEDKRIDQN